MTRTTLTTTLVAALGHALFAGACGARSELIVPDPCAGQTAAVAELAPLDVVIMMDNSGSMSFTTPSGEPRQLAVATAFRNFFEQPEAEKTSVSLSAFPILDESIPQACESDATCGMVGACQPFFTCLPSGGGACRSDGDCDDAGFPGDRCEQLGFCADGITNCAVGGGGCSDGACLPLNHCDNHYTCDAAAYEVPRVPMTELPGGADAVLSALTNLQPEGSTPTLPALTGAVRQGVAWAAEHPDHTTIVVLATDGLPTACDPEIQSGDPAVAIQNLVDEAAAGLEAGVRTFVIGLATPADGRAREDLDAIASGGGTDRAFIVDAAIADELATTLAEVRLDAGACTFVIDLPDGEVNDRSSRVRLVLPNGERPHAPWRPFAEACGDGPGFYFEPADSPQRVVLCPASCALFGRSLVRNIEVFTQCPG